MTIAPTQHISRQELQLIIDALNCYYLSDKFSDHETITRIDTLQEKIRTVRDSDFAVCILETLK